MSFLDCIQTAVENGKLAAAKQGEAVTAYENAVANNVAKGMSGSAAHNGAAMQALEAVTNTTHAKRWAKVNELRRAHELSETFSKSNDLDKDLTRLADQQEVIVDREKAKAYSMVQEFLEKHAPKFAGLKNYIGDLDELVDAAYGLPASPEISAMSKAITNMREYFRNKMNAEGTSIPHSPDNRLPQELDKGKVRTTAKDVAAARNIFVQRYMGLLDWTKMEYAGKVIPAADRVKRLEESFDAIVTEGTSRTVPGYGVGESLAVRLQRQRFFVYKDAAAYKEAMEVYGAGNLYEQLLSEIHNHARDVSLLETLGPNPAAMNGYVRGLVEKRGGEMDVVGKTKRETQTAALRSSLKLYDSRYALLTGQVNQATENWIVQAIGSTRTVFSAIFTKGAFLSSPGDASLYAGMASRWNLPVQRAPAFAYAKNFIAGKGTRKELFERQVLLEGAVSRGYTQLRQAGFLEGHVLAHKFSDTLHRVNLNTRHNDAIRATFTIDMQNGFAKEAKKSWDKVEWRELAEEMGITEKDWDVYRSVPAQETDGVRFLSPGHVYAAGHKEVADKFHDFLLFASRQLMQTQSTRVGVFFGGATDAATGHGQFLRMSSMVQSFNATMYLVHLKNAMNAPYVRTNAARLGVLGLWMTAGGAAITQVRALYNGENAHDMSTVDFWLRSVINGGTAGLLGDLAMSVWEGHGFGMSSPAGSIIGDTGDLVASVFQKDGKPGSKAARYLGRYASPFWQTKLFLQRQIWDEMLRESDPAAYNRLRSKQVERSRETETDYWWATGQEPRLPGYGRNE